MATQIWIQILLRVKFITEETDVKHILVGTNRPGSNSMKVALLIEKMYHAIGEDVEIMDLAKIDFSEISGAHYGQNPPALAPWVEKTIQSDGIHLIIPEYNGSYPGILKYFIDHWKFPQSFEFRPFCFIGIGARFGGMRPVEHMQHVFGYRNGFIYPERVFISNVWTVIKDDEFTDPVLVKLLESQVRGFSSFVHSLKASGLHANSRPLVEG